MLALLHQVAWASCASGLLLVAALSPGALPAAPSQDDKVVTKYKAAAEICNSAFAGSSARWRTGPPADPSASRRPPLGERRSLRCMIWAQYST
jgi:hypothetical protein